MAIGIALRGACISSAIDAAASKPTKSRIAKRMPLKTVFTDVSPGSNTDSVFPASPPWAMIEMARIRNGMAEMPARTSTPRTARRTP